jgi:hypothetical protein
MSQDEMELEGLRAAMTQLRFFTGYVTTIGGGGHNVS